MSKIISIACLGEDYMTPSVRLCIDSQFEFLKNNGVCKYFYCSDSHPTKELFKADVVIIGRLHSNIDVSLVYLLKKLKKKIIYMLDDDLLNVQSGMSCSEYFQATETRARIKKMIDCSEYIMSPSPIILKKFQHKKGILIEEPALNLSNQSGTNMESSSFTDSNYSKSQKNVMLGDWGGVRIGFAGSVDRSSDVNLMLGDVLIRLKDEFKEKVSFFFFGVCPAWANTINATIIPYSNDYISYREKLKDLKLDIGLAPMPENDFCACKHYNKYIEYSSLGIVGVYSNVLPYTRLNDIGAPYISVSNDSESWYLALKELIINESYRKKWQSDVYNFSLSKFSLENVTSLLLENMKDVFYYKSPKVAKIKALCYYEIIKIIKWYNKLKNIRLTRIF